MSKRIAVILAAMMAATSVQAQSTSKDPQPFGVFDTKGTFIGTYLYAETLVRHFPSGVYMINFTKAGFVVNADFLFPAANCQGTGYLSAPQPDYLPQQAYFDGINLWSMTGPLQTVSYKSSSFDGKCSNSGYVWYGAPAVIIDSTNHGFHPPFSIPGN